MPHFIRIHTAFVAMLAVLAFAAAPAAAQDYDGSYYAEAAELAKAGKLADIDFRRFRRSYMRTDGYNPHYGPVHNASMRALQAMSQKNYRDCIENAETALAHNMSSLTAHMAAYRCYEQNKNTEKAAHHRKMMTGLLGAMIKGGGGNTPDEAIYVTEPADVLGYIFITGYQPVGQLTVTRNDREYLAVKIKRPGSENAATLFFDATDMNRLGKAAAEKAIEKNTDGDTTADGRKIERTGAYFDMVKRIKSGDTDVDFLKLRRAYVNTDLYDPYYGPEKFQLGAVRTAFDHNDHEECIEAADTLLETNYASLAGHFFAAECHKALGHADKEAFHRNVFEKLVESIENSGTGKSPPSAYYTTSVAQQRSFLDAKNLAVVQEEPTVKMDGRIYSVVRVENRDTLEPLTLYFDITDQMEKGFNKKRD